MVHPVTVAAALSLCWQPPSNETYSAFYEHNAAGAFRIIDRDLQAFNQCLDNCNDQPCVQFDTRTGQCIRKSQGCIAGRTPLSSTPGPSSCMAKDYLSLISNAGTEASFSRYMRCAPQHCKELLAKYAFPVPDARGSFNLNRLGVYKLSSRDYANNPPPILDSMRHVQFDGTRLVASSANNFAEWNATIAVPNIISACRLFKTYDNVSMSAYTWGYSMPAPGSSMSSALSAPSIVQSRYPRAAELVGTALLLINRSNLCSVLNPFGAIPAPRPAPTNTNDDDYEFY